jgi:hypothetical protein
MTKTAVQADVGTEEPVVKDDAGDAVVHADENNAGASDDSDIDLDALLKEFESGVETEPKVDESGDDFDDDEPLTRKQVEELLRKQSSEANYAQKAQEDIMSAVNTVKGDLDIPDKWVRGILEMEAMEDKRFANAFAMRDEKPDAWSKILKAKSKELQTKFGKKEEKNIADDVNAAVHSATEKAPEPKEEMSPMEALQKLGPVGFERWKKQRFREKG